MEVLMLAQALVTFLSPLLPYLLKAGEKAAEEAGKKVGGDAWDKAKTLWGKLCPKVEAKPAAAEAVQDVAQDSEDADAQAALRLQLKKLLTEDKTLAQELARLWGGMQATTGSVTIIQHAGDDAIQIGQARDIDIQQ